MNLNDALVELEKETKLLNQHLDNFSHKVKELEKTLKKGVGGIKFHFRIEDDLVLAWDRNDLEENKNFRLLLIKDNKAKPLIEQKIHDRMRCIKHFDKFTIALTEYIKNYMQEMTQ